MSSWQMSPIHTIAWISLQNYWPPVSVPGQYNIESSTYGTVAVHTPIPHGLHMIVSVQLNNQESNDVKRGRK